MKNEKLDDDLDDLDFLNEVEEPNFYQDVMVQKIEKKKTLGLPLEISRRKKLINRMFNLRFGKLFFKFKPESLMIFENQLKKYYFSPNSKFLYNFPRLRKKMLFNKKINYQTLASKINLGNLLYLSETEKRKTKQEFINKKEKAITLSKNFTTQITKDIVNTEVYKVKFWDKNAKRIEQYFNKIYGSKNSDSFSENEEEEEENKNYYKQLYSQPSSNFPNLKNEKLNFKLKDYLSFDKKNQNDNNGEFDESNLDNYIKNKDSQKNITNSNIMLNLENNKINAINPSINNLKIYTLNKPNLNNKAKAYTINESSIPSIIKKNKNNKSKFLFLSRNNKDINLKANKFHKTLFNSTYKSFNSNLKKELLESSIKYKRNLTKQVKELNSHTIKCNHKLCKLIDGNITEKSRDKIKKKNEFDINKDLYDNNKNYVNTQKNRSYFDYYEIELLKSKIKKNNTTSLIKEAKNNFSEEDKFKKRELKLFPQKIARMKDDYALEMVDRLYSAHKINKEKAPEIKEVVREDRENKHKKKIIALRKKTKFNHDKIIKMGFFLSMEKDKFFQKNIIKK